MAINGQTNLFEPPLVTVGSGDSTEMFVLLPSFFMLGNGGPLRPKWHGKLKLIAWTAAAQHTDTGQVLCFSFAICLTSSRSFRSFVKKKAKGKTRFGRAKIFKPRYGVEPNEEILRSPWSIVR